MREITYCPHCHKNIKNHPNAAAVSAFYEKQNSYPYNLYYGVFGKYTKNITPEMTAGLEYALSTLDDIERKTMMKFYKDGIQPHTGIRSDGKLPPSYYFGRAHRKLREPSMAQYLMASCSTETETEGSRT